MLHLPVSSFAADAWHPRHAADLRRFAMQALERHLEQPLTTVRVLHKLAC
jgi:DNA repair protein RecO (recombination protein O)